MNDTERLNWLEKQDGASLINDDAGHWAFASDGAQDLVINGADDLWTSYLIEKHAWQSSIRDAIDHAYSLRDWCPDCGEAICDCKCIGIDEDPHVD